MNLINRIPRDRFRHAVVCLTGYSEFRRRIQRSDVTVFSLNKPPGNSPVMHFKLWRLLRKLRPDIVHTRNLAALECALPAALAGVPVRIHGEHGRDVDDLDGSNVGRQRVRRLFKPFVHHYVAVSRDLGSYLQQKVGVPPSRITQIYNGVETELFRPARAGPESLRWPRRENDGLFVIGTVGRMQEVKDPLNLVKAFILLVQTLPGARSKLKLVMAGDGPLRQRALDILTQAGMHESAWLPGSRNDVPRHHARPRLVRAALARGRHIQHPAGGDGERPAGGCDPRRRQPRADGRGDNRHPGRAGRPACAVGGDPGLRRRPGNDAAVTEPVRAAWWNRDSGWMRW